MLDCIMQTIGQFHQAGYATVFVARASGWIASTRYTRAGETVVGSETDISDCRFRSSQLEVSWASSPLSASYKHPDSRVPFHLWGYTRLSILFSLLSIILLSYNTLVSALLDPQRSKSAFAVQYDNGHRPHRINHNIYSTSLLCGSGDLRWQ